MAKYFWKITAKVVVLIVFFVILFIALFLANGYQFDFEKKDILLTSIIDLTYPKNFPVKVILDGQKAAEYLPYKIYSVAPGKHLLELRAPGFLHWKTELKVRENLVSLVNDIVFWPEQLKPYFKLEKIFDEDEELYFGRKWILKWNGDLGQLKVLNLADNLNFVNFEKREIDKKVAFKILDLEGDLLKFTDQTRQEYFYDLKLGERVDKNNNSIPDQVWDEVSRDDRSKEIFSNYQGAAWIDLKGNLRQRKLDGFVHLLVRLEEKIELISWFGENGMLIFSNDDHYYLTDKYFSNIYQIGSKAEYPFLLADQYKIYFVVATNSEVRGNLVMIKNVADGEINFDPEDLKQTRVFSVEPGRF